MGPARTGQRLRLRGGDRVSRRLDDARRPGARDGGDDRARGVPGRVPSSVPAGGAGGLDRVLSAGRARDGRSGAGGGEGASRRCGGGGTARHGAARASTAGGGAAVLPAGGGARCEALRVALLSRRGLGRVGSRGGPSLRAEDPRRSACPDQARRSAAGDRRLRRRARRPPRHRPSGRALRLRPGGERSGVLREGAGEVPAVWRGDVRAGAILPAGRTRGGRAAAAGRLSALQDRRRRRSPIH